MLLCVYRTEVITLLQAKLKVRVELFLSFGRQSASFQARSPSGLIPRPSQKVEIGSGVLSDTHMEGATGKRMVQLL